MGLLDTGDIEVGIGVTGDGVGVTYGVKSWGKPCFHLGPHNGMR